MNMSQEELKARVYGVIKDKVFISNISGQMVDVGQPMAVKEFLQFLKLENQLN